VGLIAATLNGPDRATSFLAANALGLLPLNKTGVTIDDPAPGSWTLNVANLSDPATGSSQRFVVAVEIFRAKYSVTGLDGLSTSDRAAASRALRTGLMAAQSGDFAGSASATRLDVARAVMLAAGVRVPQYLPDSPTFTDEPSDDSVIFIESVAHSPYGDLMGTTGKTFNPQAQIDRATVAVAMVKALGLDQEAQAASATNPGLLDWNSISPGARGYVSVAVSRGLVSATFGYFRPQDLMTRVELAAAAIALQQAAR